MMSGESRHDLPPTRSQIELLAAYVRCGSWAAAAHERGVQISTAQNTASDLYHRLGVTCAIEAIVALGWIDTRRDYRVAEVPTPGDD
jgi:hypothetical protein